MKVLKNIKFQGIINIKKKLLSKCENFKYNFRNYWNNN